MIIRDGTDKPLVLRPSAHAQGRNLFVVNSLDELLNAVHERPQVFSNGWYASELIDKVAEYRVYVSQSQRTCILLGQSY